MTRDEAIELLKTAPRDDEPSRINRSMTRKQATEIIERAIIGNSPRMYQADGVTLDLMFEKRVNQVVHDRKRISPHFV